MQPGPTEGTQPDGYSLATVMERVMTEVRRQWFDALVVPLDCAASVIEPGGELIMFVDGSPGAVDLVVDGAASRRACVLATSVFRPADLGMRLRSRGYRMVQRQWVYVLDPQATQTAGRSQRPHVLPLLRRREPLAVTVRAVGAEDLPAWSEACRLAFGSRGTPGAALDEKRRAFQNMGNRAAWYLATCDGDGIGTACMYDSGPAAQVMSVGTVPSFRERGVATAVMECVIRDWCAHGSGFLFLDATAESQAERLYRRLGFRRVYSRELYAPARVPILTDL